MIQLESEIVATPSIKSSINPDAYYSRREAAAALGLAPITLLRNEQREKLKAARVGRRVLYRGSELIRWLEAGSEKKVLLRFQRSQRESR